MRTQSLLIAGRIFQMTVFFLMTSFLMAQEQQLYQIDEVKEAPVFPKCENIKPTRKKEMANCINRQLTILLSKKLSGFNETLLQSHLTSAEAKIQFIISKEGILMNPMESEDSHPLLAEAAIHALNELSYEIPPIRPAKNKKGEAVNLAVQLPIKFTATQLDNVRREAIYPVDEVVLFSMQDGSIRYEVRLYKEKHIKIYEIENDRTFYLGRFMSLGEAEKSEPYRTLIAKERSSNPTFVTDGYLNDEFFEVYIYYLFDRKKPIYIEVFQLQDNKKTLRATFEKEREFNESMYAPLIYR